MSIQDNITKAAEQMTKIKTPKSAPSQKKSGADKRSRTAENSKRRQARHQKKCLTKVHNVPRGYARANRRAACKHYEVKKDGSRVLLHDVNFITGKATGPIAADSKIIFA